MGDIRGFIKHKRSLPGVELPHQRVQHSKEFVAPPNEEHQTEQAARCMDCGIPFCHSACPLGNLIPDFNDAVYQGEWENAFDLLMETNNFPEFTGRICPAPCEGSCVLGINEDAVTIEYIEKSIIEKAFENGWVKPRIPAIRKNKSIAIIGSGPAGLACADDLNQKGFKVTIFEKNAQPGGLLRYGIPDFKLGKDIVERRIKLMEAEGVAFVNNTNIGVDITTEELQNQFDSIVMCGGSEKPRDLLIEGREFEGIHFAMDFLKRCNEKVSEGLENDINVSGKKVVVIGGGDTGSDCIGNSNRNGAEEVIQIEIMGKPSESRTDDNPWPEWPMILKTSSSHQEGADRKWALMTKRFVSDNNKDVSGLEVVQVTWEKDDNGRFQMTEVAGTTKIIPCDVVLIAAGFISPQAELLDQFGVAKDERGNVLTSNFKTSVANVYSAGDMRRGQSLVVWAIAEGRDCAAEIAAQ